MNEESVGETGLLGDVERGGDIGGGREGDIGGDNGGDSGGDRG